MMIDLCDLSFYNVTEYPLYPKECLSEDQICNDTFYNVWRPLQCSVETRSTEVILACAIATIGVLPMMICLGIFVYKTLLLQPEIMARSESVLPNMSLNGQGSDMSSWQNAVKSMPLVKFIEILHFTLEKYTSKYQKKDNAVSTQQSSCEENDTNEINTESGKYFESSCAICLSNYKEGDDISRSSTNMCRHTFHKACVIEWLVAARNPSCPCCRRMFLDKERLQIGKISFEEDSESIHELEV